MKNLVPFQTQTTVGSLGKNRPKIIFMTILNENAIK